MFTIQGVHGEGLLIPESLISCVTIVCGAYLTDFNLTVFSVDWKS